MKEYLLALDAGTGSGRCVLVSTDGSECVSVAREWGYVPEPEAGPLACHFEPDSFWSALAATVRDALERAGIGPGQVVGVSSTSQREGLVLLGADGRELYAGPNRDLRAREEGSALAAAAGDRIHELTGHYPSGIFAAARLLWFRRWRPDLYERFERLLMINDWVLYRLSGEAASEPSNACETCLFDLGRGCWAEDLMGELELPRRLFPAIVPSGTRIGSVVPAAAAMTGLRAGTPVVTGGADTQCGVLGTGAIEPGQLALVAGTTAPLQMVTAEPRIDPDRRLWSGAHLRPGRYVLESNAGGAGTVYRWFRDAFCQPEQRRAQRSRRSAFELVDELAARTPAGASGARSFLGVMLMDARSMPAPGGTLEVGDTLWSGGTPRGALARAILEALAFAARANAEQVATVTGDPVERIGACGGLTRSPLYLTILAAVMGCEVAVPRWREGSGIGAAICAGVGAGTYPSFEAGVAELVRPGVEMVPDPALAEVYAGLYDSWLQRYHTLAGRTAGPSDLPTKET